MSAVPSAFDYTCVRSQHHDVNDVLAVLSDSKSGHIMLGCITMITIIMKIARYEASLKVLEVGLAPIAKILSWLGKVPRRDAGQKLE